VCVCVCVCVVTIYLKLPVGNKSLLPRELHVSLRILIVFSLIFKVAQICSTDEVKNNKMQYESVHKQNYVTKCSAY
jgi:hypothetical protein